MTKKVNKKNKTFKDKDQIVKICRDILNEVDLTVKETILEDEELKIKKTTNAVNLLCKVTSILQKIDNTENKVEFEAQVEKLSNAEIDSIVKYYNIKK